MSISTYSELQTAVINYSHRADLATALPDLIKIAENRIFKEVRTREMETALSFTMSSGVGAVPADYLELKSAYIDSSPTMVLQRAAVGQIYQDYPLRTSTAKPSRIAREGANFIFGPYPDADYSVKGIYYAKPTSIQTSVNSLFTAHPELYLFATLCEVADYVKSNDDLQKWQNKYEFLKMQANNYENQEYGSGGGLEVSVA